MARTLAFVLLAGGMLLAADETPRLTELPKNLEPFEYVEADIPFYPPKGTKGGPLRKMQAPLAPAESMKHLVHPDHLEVKLFIAEPQLTGKPICMNWDERGRLWVAVTVDYPNELKPAGQGRDRILICADTDGDGAADKVTVFADKLSIPTSLAFANGGVVVHQAPDTLFLKDTDGDDVSDVRKVLFKGWNTGDTHAGPSNLRYGLDNWLHGIVGYAGFEGTIAGEKHSFRTGFYRFKPEGKLEFLRNTNNNSWGVGFSEDGLHFGSTANGNPSVYLPIPNRYYERVRGWSSSVLGGIADSNRFQPITDKVRQVDFHGGFTAAAGHALYTARTYPEAYWNRTAFVCEPTGHLAAAFVLERQGADFRARYGWNLLASDDEWVAPVMAEVGPDGNVWVIDWYNYIVQHNPTPPGFKTGTGNAYETSLRDKKHGRIYRLVHKQAKAGKPYTLAGADLDKLIATLSHDNMLWRLHAQRLLVERGQCDIVPDLIKLAADRQVDAVGLNVGAIHALWTLHGLGAYPEALQAGTVALEHRSAGVRRNALLVLPQQKESVSAILDSKILDDADAQVRLAALLALAEQPPSEQAGAALADRFDKAANLNERWLPDGFTAAAAAHDRGFLQALLARQTPPDAKALKIAGIVAEHHARGTPPDVVNSLRKLASGEPRVAETILDGFARGWPKGKPLTITADDDKELAALFAKLPAASQGHLIRLATALGSKAFAGQAEAALKSLFAVVAAADKTDVERARSARQCVELAPDSAAVVDKLLEAVTPRTSPELTAALLDALGESRAKDLGARLLTSLPGWTPSARAAAIRILLRRPDSTAALLEAIDKNNLPVSELALDQRQALAAHPDQAIAARARKLFERGGGLPSADRVKVLQALLPATAKKGDALKGKEVFKTQCAKCHTHTGEGNKVGPDLTGMAVHTKEHLLTDIIDPSRNVEGNFRVYVVETRDGRILSGLLASESKTAIELIDAEGKPLRVLREDLESLTATTKSLMPEGFEKQVPEASIVDLLEFLTQRGKYLPLPLDRVATIDSTQGMFNSKEADAERLIFPDWSPKTFVGVPFVLVAPGNGRPNVVLLHGPQGKIPPTMPRSVRLPCNAPVKALHLLSGVSGWGFPLGRKGSVSLIVRLHYDDGKTEDHELKNGEHFADYIRRVDVPGSKFAFALRGQQLRYLSVQPGRTALVKDIELVKGSDDTAPVVVALTAEPLE